MDEGITGRSFSSVVKLRTEVEETLFVFLDVTGDFRIMFKSNSLGGVIVINDKDTAEFVERINSLEKSKKIDRVKQDG